MLVNEQAMVNCECADYIHSWTGVSRTDSRWSIVSVLTIYTASSAGIDCCVDRLTTEPGDRKANSGEYIGTRRKSTCLLSGLVTDKLVVN